MTEQEYDYRPTHERIESDLEPLARRVEAARAVEAAAETERKLAEAELIEAMQRFGAAMFAIPQLGEYRVVNSRTLKVRNARLVEEALAEKGMEIPYKTSIDTGKLRDVSDLFLGDLPGVEIVQATYLRRTDFPARAVERDITEKVRL